MSDDSLKEDKPIKLSKMDEAAMLLEQAAKKLDGVTGKRKKTAGMVAAELRQIAARLLSL